MLAHAGVLVLLAVCFLTWAAGVDGQLALVEDESGDALFTSDRSQLTTVWDQQENRLPLAFIFEPGPTDWPEGKTLALSPLGGVELRVLKFYRHARTEERWGEDASPAAGPAVQLCAGRRRRHAAGPTMVHGRSVCRRGPSRSCPRDVRAGAGGTSMREDFVNPPSAGDDTDGVLSIHHAGRMYRIPVRENIGKKVAVGKSDIQVEITSYLPDARPDAAAHFTTASKQPNNPLLELMVYLPGKDAPVRQIAFAKHPLLNLDAIHGRDCPIKFWYHHPAASPEAGTQLLQTPDGKLYYRVVVDGKLLSHGEAREGSRIGTPGPSRLLIVKYLPHARQKSDFLPVRAWATTRPLPNRPCWSRFRPAEKRPTCG